MKKVFLVIVSILIILLFLVNEFIYSFTDAHLTFFGCGHKYVTEVLVNTNLNGYWHSVVPPIHETYDIETIEQALKNTGKYEVIVNDKRSPLPIKSGGFDLDGPGIYVADFEGNAIRLSKNDDDTWMINFTNTSDFVCSVPDFWLKRPFVRIIGDMQISYKQRQALINMLDIGKTSTANIFI